MGSRAGNGNGNGNGSAVSEAPVDVALDELRFGLSPREVDQEPDHVATLAGVLPELPPIVVHAPSMNVIDGVHRVSAARTLGQPTIPAVFFHGSDTDAAIQAIARNVTHGKPLTLAERESAADRVLRIHPTWSDRRIGGVCGLSPKTVARLRAFLSTDVAPVQARIGRDGKVRATDPTELRQRIADAVHADPSASIRALAARTGASQRTVQDVRGRIRRGESILSPRAQAKQEREDEAAAVPTKDDPAYVSRDGGEAFTDWLECRLLADDDEWEPFVSTIPISRVYEVADAARRCAGVWERFASAVEGRARGGTSTNGGNP